ncbi:hypothetical protein ACI1MP_35800 [Kitasatospora griseola]|uniref:hypothetical protein n=1 Tax=Kitasatospora griseola TaxID=2064 RepID=UPI0038560E45
MPTFRDELAPLRAELLALAEGLAHALGADEWTVEPRRIPGRHPCVELVRAEDGACVLIQQERLRRDRWLVNVALPDGTYYDRHGLDAGDITVTRAKVAVDVQRLLLPTLNAAVAEMSRRQHQHLTDVHEVTAVARRLKTVPLTASQPSSTASRRHDEDTTRTLRWSQGPGTSWASPHAVVNVHRARFGSVEITCSHLTPAMAEAVLRALNASLPATAQAA